MKRLRKDFQGFLTTFDTDTGFSIRTDIKTNDGKIIEPFMATAPELLDICITKFCPGPIVNGIYTPCSYCYMNSNGSDRYKEMYMRADKYESILEQVKDDCFQVALGGGEPTKHPNFIEILKTTRKYNMVPNYTTNGSNLTYEICIASKKYCGAVAVSLHDKVQCIMGMSKLINYGIKTNIHVVITKERAQPGYMKKLLDEFPSIINDLNAVIFLLHKPVGRAQLKNQPSPKEAEDFVNEVLKWEVPFKIGFDACFAPALVQNKVNSTTFDYCDGGRFSGFVDWDMKMYPCSFASHDQKNGLSLNDHTFKEVWNSKLFDNFRFQFKTRCQGCPDLKICGAGCPICPEIIPCSQRSKYERFEL